MKAVKLFLIATAVFFMACNNQQNKADKNMQNDALLVENAKVSEDKEGGESESVEDFVKEAASAGLMEVELGRYAEQNAMNPRVRNFGTMMVRDHSKANDELKAVASQKNLQVPSTMEDSHMNKLNELKKKTGAEFDKEYMKEMVDDHEKDVDNFRKQSENGSDPDVKAFASRTLPILQMHLDSAKSIRDALK